MSKQRSAPRFPVGQRVRIKDTITTRHVGREGVVVAVKQHTNTANTTLDRYTVSLSEDEEAEFFEIQLERVDRYV
jgi:hypothetical protein